MRDVLIGVGLTCLGFYCGFRGWEDASAAGLNGVGLALFAFAGLICLSVAWLKSEINDLKFRTNIVHSELRYLVSQDLNSHKRVLVSGSPPVRMPTCRTIPRPELIRKHRQQLVGDAHPFATDAFVSQKEAVELEQIRS